MPDQNGNDATLSFSPQERKICISFKGDLNFFLPPQKRKKVMEISFQGKRQVKDLIQSLRVPHTEVGGIRVHHCWKDFSYILEHGDQVDVFPLSPYTFCPKNPIYIKKRWHHPAFLCDVHLWKLARRLRLLGFDTRFNRQWDDPQLADIANKENIILLTRDRGLLMRNKVTHGLYVRNTDPEEQVVEILQRLNISNQAHPFSRCLVCNHLLKSVPPGDQEFEKRLVQQVPEGVRQHCNHYFFCPSCGRIFWKGSHFKRLNHFIDRYLTRQ